MTAGWLATTATGSCLGNVGGRLDQRRRPDDQEEETGDELTQLAPRRAVLQVFGVELVVVVVGELLGARLPLLETEARGEGVALPEGEGVIDQTGGHDLAQLALLCALQEVMQSLLAAGAALFLLPLLPVRAVASTDGPPPTPSELKKVAEKLRVLEAAVPPPSPTSPRRDVESLPRLAR